MGIYENEMKLEFLSKSNNEAFARIAVAAFASQIDPTIEELADIKTAVSEAVTNSIIHGYEDRDDGIITVECKIEDNVLNIEITDNGVGIEDIEVAKEPLYTTKPNLERPFRVKHGMIIGILATIMAGFMALMYLIPTVSCALTWQEWIIVGGWALIGVVLGIRSKMLYKENFASGMDIY